MTLVRISNVSDLATARACAALNIDFIGLNLTHGKPNAISPIKVSDYVQWLSGIEVVAQAHHLDEAKAKRFMELLQLKHVEILLENFEEGDKNLWYFGNTDSLAKGTLVSTENSPNSFKVIEKLEELEGKSAPLAKADIPIDLFKTEDGVDWEKVNTVIDTLKS